MNYYLQNKTKINHEQKQYSIKYIKDILLNRKINSQSVDQQYQNKNIQLNNSKLLKNKYTYNNSVVFQNIKHKQQRRSMHQTKNDQSKNIKLPTIPNKKKNLFNQQHQTNIQVLNVNQNNKKFSHPGLIKIKNITKCIMTQQRQDDNIPGFLKYMQIKSVVPMKKSPKKMQQRSQNIKIKKQKSIPSYKFSKNKRQKQNNSPQLSQKYSKNKLDKIVHTKSTSKIQQNSKQKLNQQKNQKSKTSYSIRKQSKTLSKTITNPIRSKKITNSYPHFLSLIRSLNGVTVINSSSTYRAYVGKGNNSILIKNCLKSRFWWNITDNQNDVNLFWSQNKQQKFVQLIKKTQPNKNKNQQIKSIQYILQKNNQKQLTPTLIDSNPFNRLMSKQQRKKYTKQSKNYKIQVAQGSYQLISPNKNRIHNHLQFHWYLSNKKALLYNLKKYYTQIGQNPFQYIPVSYHIQSLGDSQWQNFKLNYQQLKNNKQKLNQKQNNQQKINKKKKKQKQKNNNLWIVKPGQNSNQGNGIQVFDNIQQISQIVKNSGLRPNGKMRTYIVQKYLLPFLYYKRKFDIRCYVLVTCVKGIYKAYWYQQGYIRTSSKQFTLKNLKNRFVHLTNDAVQKKCQDYGKYQNCNKVSYSDFQKYLDNNFPDKKYNFYETILPAMIKRAADSIKSTCMAMDPNKLQNIFQIFGLDFMIDDQFYPWLIQVNTNPCLQLNSPLLSRIIPNMIQNSLRIAVDPIFPPPLQIPKNKSLPNDSFQSNKFTLIFNSNQQQQILMKLTKNINLSNIAQSDQDENHDDIQ